MIAVQEMNKELFSYDRTHCSFWHIPSSGMLTVCSRSPEIFFQLHTLHGQCDIIIFPCVFSLLPNKNENTYNRLFEQFIPTRK